MQPANTVLIMSDEHNRNCLGCHGDPIVRTPNLDALAARGIRFTNAYTNAPICVPARASMALGRYPHQIGAWDSTCPFDGSRKGWGARLLDAGHEVVSVGKLHFRSSEDANGFAEELLPMHVIDGIGYLYCLLRDPPEPIATTRDLAEEAGPGESDYTHYDRSVTRAACEWIADAGRRDCGKPWTLYVGLVAPHYPLRAPTAFYHLYDDVEIPPPILYAEHERPRHPVLDGIRLGAPYDDAFDAERVRVAQQAYYGLCSFLDDNVGRILQAIETSGLSATTRVIYTSDHGECLGNRGLWTKSVMYEDAAAIPLLVAGPGLPAGVVAHTPASLIDLHPTLTDFAGLARHADDADLPGDSLAKLVTHPDPDRVAFSEYHDWNAITGMFMLRQRNWKLVRYPGHASQLFDLAADPQERHDRSGDPALAHVLEDLEVALANICDVCAVNARAFAAQATKIALHGGRAAIRATSSGGHTPAPTRVVSAR